MNNKSLSKISVIICCALVSIIFCNLAFATQGEVKGDEKKEVKAYTKAVPDEVKQYLEESADGIAESMAVSVGLKQAVVEFGNTTSVLGTDSMFYVPTFIDGEFKYLLSLGISDDGIVVSYFECEWMKYVLSEEERFYFYSDDVGVYVVGENRSYVVCNKKAIEVVPTYNPLLVEECAVVDMNGKVIRTTVDESSTKSILSKELSRVPRVGNEGKTCWAACAAAVCQYYGNNAVTGDLAHTYAHGVTHTRANCTGASMDETYSVIHNLAAKSGTKILEGTPSVSRLNAANVMQSVNSNVPVVVGFKSYDSNNICISAHMMVFTGYQFNNTTGAFTYNVMDPNFSSRRYIYGTYSGTNVVYSMNGKSYKWKEAIYDWH